MALIAAHLNAGVILEVTVQRSTQVSIFPHHLGSQDQPVRLWRQLGVKKA